MSDQMAAELYDRLVALKTPSPPVERVFLRGFNAGVDAAIKQLKLTCDEVVDEDVSRESGEAA